MLVIDLDRALDDVVVVVEKGADRGEAQTNRLEIVTGSRSYRLGNLSLQPPLPGIGKALREIDTLPIADAVRADTLRSEGIREPRVLKAASLAGDLRAGQPRSPSRLDRLVPVQNRSDKSFSIEGSSELEDLRFEIGLVERSLTRIQLTSRRRPQGCHANA